MPSLTVWKFPTPLGVEAAELRLKILEENKAITIHDRASLIWFPDATSPRVRHLHGGGRAAGKGTMWGAVFGMIFLAPVAGAAIGAAGGALVHRLRDAGIGEDFISEVREAVIPGTSALFVLSSDADPEQVRAMLARDPDITLIHADLSDDVRERLGDILGDDPA